jgi:SAM-dependent methyltransferase
VRYKVDKYIIRSENAAKLPTEASGPLVSWINAQPSVSDVLDYGCGKLRYAAYLARRATRLTLVDSAIQLDRPRAGRREMSVRQEAVARWPHARVLDLEAFNTDRRRYQLILCANVLSAIPSPSVRATVLRALADRLTTNGRCLFVVQFRNSYFREIVRSPRARPHLDGWLYDGPRGASYYGVLPNAKLEKLVRRYGHRIERSWTVGESALVLTRCS